MKRIKLLVIATLAFVGLTMQAQEVKQIEASVDDYIALLNQSGYQAYSFDISQLMDTTYYVQFEVREYVAGNPEPVMVHPYGRGLKNRTMVKDFMWRERSEEELADIRAASVDYENGVYSRAEKITVGFLPCKNDSTEVGKLFVENQGASGFSLSLKQIDHKGAYNEDVIYSYNTLPFKTSAFEEGKFIPLAAYASFWFDERFNIIRFCGATELDPDMTTEILKDTPHYFVIGVIFSKA
jgi:hypothetical protein